MKNLRYDIGDLVIYTSPDKGHRFDAEVVPSEDGHFLELDYKKRPRLHITLLGYDFPTWVFVTNCINLTK